MTKKDQTLETGTPEIDPQLSENLTTPKPEQTPEIDVKGLLEELKAAGVQTSEDLQGKLTASREAGQLANLLGEVRQENKNLREMVKQLPRASQTPAAELGNEFNEFMTPDSSTLEGIVARALDQRDAKYAETQRVAQAQVLQLWNEIQTDSDFPLVKDVWEKRMQDPNFLFQIQNGAIDPLKAYNGLVRDYYKGIVKKSFDTISVLQGKEPIKPPYVEQPGKGTPPPESPEAKVKMDKLREAVDKGKVLDDDEQIAALRAFLGT